MDKIEVITVEAKEISPHRLMLKFYIDLPPGMKVLNFEFANKIKDKLNKVLNGKQGDKI